MHLLFADKLPEQTIEDLEARGHVCVMEPDAERPTTSRPGSPGSTGWWCAAPRSSARCSRLRTG